MIYLTWAIWQSFNLIRCLCKFNVCKVDLGSDLWRQALRKKRVITTINNILLDPAWLVRVVQHVTGLNHLRTCQLRWMEEVHLQRGSNSHYSTRLAISSMTCDINIQDNIQIHWFFFFDMFFLKLCSLFRCQFDHGCFLFSSLASYHQIVP